MLDQQMVRRIVDDAGLQDATVQLWALDGRPERIVIDSGRWIYPASMIKTPLAVAVAIAVEAGRLAWSDRVAVDASNMTVNDAPSPLAPQIEASVQELVELMLSRSDNVATNVLIDTVGRGRATADLSALGFGQTAIRRKVSGALPLIDDPDACGRNSHCARDSCALFERLARGDIAGAQLITAALARQYWNGKLSAGLAPHDTFAHKTGDTDEVSHDGGILSLGSGERYALAIYTTLPSNEQTDRRFGDFMARLRPLLGRVDP